jgi:hypothetical protein
LTDARALELVTVADRLAPTYAVRGHTDHVRTQIAEIREQTIVQLYEPARDFPGPTGAPEDRDAGLAKEPAASKAARWTSCPVQGSRRRPTARSVRRGRLFHSSATTPRSPSACVDPRARMCSPDLFSGLDLTHAGRECSPDCQARPRAIGKNDCQVLRELRYGRPHYHRSAIRCHPLPSCPAVPFLLAQRRSQSVHLAGGIA